MVPLKQVGATASVATGTLVAATVNGASLLLVSNTSSTAWGYFSQFPTNSGTPAVTGVPVPPNGQVLVVAANGTEYWGANGETLDVTPVEIQKF